MGKEMLEDQSVNVGLENGYAGKKMEDYDENAHNLAELLADVIVENIIKKFRDGRNRICKDQ